MGALALGLTFSSLLCAASSDEIVWLKGTFHQHATQPLKKCLYAASDVDGSGAGSDLHKQDDGGTDVNTTSSRPVAVLYGSVLDRDCL